MPTGVREMHQWSHTCVQIQVFPEGHLRSRLVFWHQGRRRRCWCLSPRPAPLCLLVYVSVSRLLAGRSDGLMLTHTTHTCRQVHLGAEASVARCQRGRCKDPRHPSLGHHPRAGGSLCTYIHVHTYTSIYLSIYLSLYIYRCIHTHISCSLSLSLSLSVSLSLSLSLSLSIYIYVYMYICISYQHTMYAAYCIQVFVFEYLLIMFSY